ncbi:MAG: thiamine pyrophosphate-dependent enzyme [Alphaproteobacteria bacterium]
MPAASAAWKDKGLFRRNVPQFKAELCVGCIDCALVCPDAAIPNAVHEMTDLMLTALPKIDLSEERAQAVRAAVPGVADAVREALRKTKKGGKPFHELVAEMGAASGDATLSGDFAKLAEVLAVFPVAKTKPFFDSVEKSDPGTGGLFSVSIDPWKCSGCLECVDVCGPGALVEREQTPELLDNLQAGFEFLSNTPGTPDRFYAGASDPNAKTKRLLLNHENYYAVTGGHGACRGCGEVTAIRMILATSRAIHGDRRKAHLRELESLIESLNAKRAELQPNPDDPKRAERIAETSSVYASTFPFNPYTDPWVNSLFQDAAPLSKGIFEGLSADMTADMKAMRIGHLEVEDAYVPAEHDKFFRFFNWRNFTEEELSLIPTVLSIGGDGATYDIGFGALSRLLASKTPVKVVVLNTGAYSNTGGQASTASYTAQDSDLSRVGSTQAGIPTCSLYRATRRCRRISWNRSLSS